MAADVPMLDDVIKEYLIFRGFSGTLKSFESDLKADKDKSFRVSSARIERRGYSILLGLFAFPSVVNFC